MFPVIINFPHVTKNEISQVDKLMGKIFAGK